MSAATEANGKAPVTARAKELATLTPADLSKELNIPSALIRRVQREHSKELGGHSHGQSWQMAATDNARIVAWVREAQA